MVFFNWEKVLKHSKRKNAEIVFLLWYLTYRPVARYKTDFRIFRYSEINWEGNSFVKNPELLLKNERKYSKIELAQYIALAARRNYAEYRAIGTLRLDILLVDNLQPLKNNRLLNITGKEVQFLYEET